MAAWSAPRAEVRAVHPDACPASCFRPPIGDPAAVEDDAADIILFRLGGARADDAGDPGFAMNFDRRTTPTVLVSGLPSPFAWTDTELRGVSPYDFFAGVIDIPLFVDARTGLAAGSFFLFAPSLIGRVTLTDVLSTGHAFFGKYWPPPRPAL
jgi:hypothetical protein